MESNIEHEDLLIKLHGMLNQEKIKLWEPPYTTNDNSISSNLQELGERYAASLSLAKEMVINGLYELQMHSINKCRAISEFKETGLATFRVKVTSASQKPRTLTIQKKLDAMGSDLIDTVANEVGMAGSRVKLIYNGKLIKATSSLEEQGIKNGVTMMALIMGESQSNLMKTDKEYKEMKTTIDDATLLSEHVDSFVDDEYMKIEDQSGKALELPAAERRSLMVGLALHERGRAAARAFDYSLALVLFLEADRQLAECRSSILSSVDNWAVLQLDIAWCYLCLRSLPAAPDARARLVRAEAALLATYGESNERLIALKGTAANERVLLMRLYLLQGIVAYHQNNRAEARALLEKAENELRFLKVDETAVTALLELGWTQAQARTGLRAAGGDLDRAHHYLADRRQEREQARERHQQEKQRQMALKRANNHAMRLMEDQPELMDSDEALSTPSNEDLPGVPDSNLVAELEAMGYSTEDCKMALRFANNELTRAVDLLVAATDYMQSSSSSNPSTSRESRHRLKKYLKEQFLKRREREAALKRLSSKIGGEEDDHLDTSLVEEEKFLAQYKSLL